MALSHRRSKTLNYDWDTLFAEVITDTEILNVVPSVAIESLGSIGRTYWIIKARGRFCNARESGGTSLSGARPKT